MSIQAINNQISPVRFPYAVLVEQQNSGWTAQVLGWAECQSSGESREIALERLQQIVKNRLSHSEVVYLDLPVSVFDNPLMQYAGMFKDDSQFEQVLAEIEMYRHELDAEREALTDSQIDE